MYLYVYSESKRTYKRCIITSDCSLVDHRCSNFRNHSKHVISEDICGCSIPTLVKIKDLSSYSDVHNYLMPLVTVFQLCFNCNALWFPPQNLCLTPNEKLRTIFYLFTPRPSPEFGLKFTSKALSPATYNKYPYKLQKMLDYMIC